MTRPVDPGYGKLTIKAIQNIELTHFENKIHVSTILKQTLAEWYHKMKVHPETSRLEAVLRKVYWWHNLRKDVEHCCKHCHICQLAKKQ